MATAEVKQRPSRRWRMLRAIGVVVLLLVVVVVAAPYAMTVGIVRNSVFALLFHNIHGEVTADALRCGWFTPPEIDNFAIRTYAGEPVVAVERVTLEHSPWQLLCRPSEIGRIEVDHPSIELIAHEGSSNFAEVFRGPRQGIPPRLRQESIQLIVRNAEFRWKLGNSDHDWGVGGMQLTGRLEPEWMTSTGEARLVIDPITVIDHAELTREMCDDLLKYVVPELAKAKLHGAGSLVLAGGTIPLDHLRDVELSGVLVLHDIDVGGGGTIIQAITSKLGMGEEVELAREDEVHFAVAKQRVHHDGLELGTGELRIGTAGDVGFDQSLDLLAEVRVDLLPSTVEKRPALAPLNNRSLKLPVQGTLEKPQIRWGTIGQDLASQLGDVLRGGGETGTVQDLVQGLLDKNGASDAAGTGKAAAELTGTALDLLKQMRDRRRERQAAEDPDAAKDGSPLPAAEPPPTTPRRPLLDRLRERRQEQDAGAKQPPPNEP